MCVEGCSYGVDSDRKHSNFNRMKVYVIFTLSVWHRYSEILHGS